LVLCSCRTLILGSTGLLWTSDRSSALLEPLIFYCSRFAYLSASMKNSSVCLSESLFLTWKAKSTGCTDFRKLVGSWRFSGNLCPLNILPGDAPILFIPLRCLTGLKLGAYFEALLIILLVFRLFGLYSFGTPPESRCTLFSFLLSASSLYGEPVLLLLRSSSELKFLLVRLNLLYGLGILWWIMLLCLLLGLNNICDYCLEWEWLMPSTNSLDEEGLMFITSEMLTVLWLLKLFFLIFSLEVMFCDTKR
jgi:hypothetical protein